MAKTICTIPIVANTPSVTIPIDFATPLLFFEIAIGTPVHVAKMKKEYRNEFTCIIATPSGQGKEVGYPEKVKGNVGFHEKLGKICAF